MEDGKLVLRSYRTPLSPELLDMASVPPSDPVAYLEGVEKRIEDTKGAILAEKARQEEEMHVLPPDPVWDLKRDLAPRLRQLEEETQRSIVEIVRHRQEEEEEEQV